MDPREVFEGERFTLTCSVSRLVSDRLRPQDVNFSLFKDQHPLEAPGGSYSSVALPSSSADYSCRAQGRNLGNLIAKNSTHLHLEVKGELKQGLSLFASFGFVRLDLLGCLFSKDVSTCMWLYTHYVVFNFINLFSSSSSFPPSPSLPLSFPIPPSLPPHPSLLPPSFSTCVRAPAVSGRGQSGSG